MLEHADKTALGIVEYEVVALSSAESNTVVSGVFLETTSRGELHRSDMRHRRSRECQEKKETCRVVAVHGPVQPCGVRYRCIGAVDSVGAISCAQRVPDCFEVVSVDAMQAGRSKF